MPDPTRRTVWSSDGPTPAAGAGKPGAPPPPVPPTGPVRVRLERQGRGGKVVTVLDNLPGHPAAIETLCATLKGRCGAGGTVKGRTIELQGDHRDRLMTLLPTLGLPAKRAGG